MRNKLICPRCGAIDDTRIKMGGLVCNVCNIIVAYPGTEAYNQRLEAERHSGRFLVADTSTVEDPRGHYVIPVEDFDRLIEDLVGKDGEVATSETSVEGGDTDTLVKVSSMWRPN